MALITPELIDSSEPVMRALQENPGYASTTLKGQGSSLLLSYASAQPLQVYMIATKDDGSFVPTDFMHFVLPPGDPASARIDLTVSPGWSSGERRYLIHMLSPVADASASFYQADFIPATASQTLTAPVRHLFRPEPYTPGTFHALFGYRMSGTPVVVIFAITALFLCVLCLLIPTFRSVRMILTVLIAVQMLYALRFSIDLLRFSGQHLTEYHVRHSDGEAAGTYDEAGYVYDTAAVIKNYTKNMSMLRGVFVCRDGTNFKEKLLRYLVYPLPVRSDLPDFATIAVVTDKYKQGWTYEDGTLRCGELSRMAEKIKSYPDGTHIFHVL